MEEPRDFLSGLIVGGLIGAAFGLLFAPEPGDRTRERLRRQSGEWGGRAREQADRVAEIATKARSSADDVIKRGRDTFDEKTDQLRRAFEDGRDSTRGRSRERRSPEGSEG